MASAASPGGVGNKLLVCPPARRCMAFSSVRYVGEASPVSIWADPKVRDWFFSYQLMRGSCEVES